ncbi:hypothetical protein OIV19_21750 [Brucella sp. HL-2]|nr:hypothetical protein [Brucella sp. HL-2]MCV9910222.1 hypothetical protein [Brucella sp. HL-2]
MTLPAFCPIAINSPAAKPEIASGAMLTVIVLLRVSTGREVMVPAYYLNAYPLMMDDGCDDCHQDHQDEGCPCTGWYQQIYHPDYDDAYAPLRGEVLAWSRLPELDVVKALVLNAAGKPAC